MKKLTLLLAFMAVTMLCHAQVFGKEDKENRARLAKLKVKGCAVYQTNYQYFFGKPQPSKEFKASVTKLNKAGDIIEDIGYNERGTIESWMKFGNDNKGTNTFVASYNSNGTLNVKVISKNNYNPNGKLTESLMYKNDTSLFYKASFTYDSLGNMIQVNYYNIMSYVILEKYEKYFYDANGRTVRKEYYSNSDAGYYNAREEWKYDSSGKTTEKTAYYISVYKYLPNGLISEHTDYGEGNKIAAKYRYAYEFNP